MSPLGWPFDGIGSALGDGFKNMVSSAFEAAMTAIWQASLTLLHVGVGLADQFSVFSVSTTEGPVKLVWPMMLWISGLLALGLFCWQLIMVNLRGGRGFVRLVTGPVQYGVALAVTVGMVATFLAAVDGLTAGILSYGLQSRNFTDALTHTSFGTAAENGVKAVVLGICALVGVIPASIGYVLEMLFREAAIYVLVSTVPLVAAGLVANVSAPWFWKTARGLLASIAMKPALALALVLGVAIAGGSQGVAGLLAGIGVLVISLLAPFVLFRLFAFIDPHSEAGGAFREFVSGKGVDSYGPNNPAMALAGAGAGSVAIEEANTGRFDDAIDDSPFGEFCPDRDDEHDNRQQSARWNSPPRREGRPDEGDGGGHGGADPPPPEPPDQGGRSAAHPDDSDAEGS